MTQDTTPASGVVAKPFEDPAPPFNKWRGEMQAALKSSGIYAARSPGTGNKLTLRWRDTRKAVQPAPQPVARESLTPERVKEIVRGAGYDQCGIPDTERAAFINGLRHGEREHGIKRGQHGTK